MLRRVSAPAGVVAVVKADGYGHGAAPVAAAALDAGAAAVAVAIPARVSRCATTASTRRTLVLSEPRPTSARSASPSTSSPPCTRRRASRPPPRPRPTTARRLAGAPQGRHRHAPRRRRPADAVALAEAVVRRAGPRAGVGVDPLRHRRRARRPVHRRAARPVRRRARRASPPAASPSPCATPPTRPARLLPPRGPLRPRPRRHRRLRHRARARPRRPRRGRRPPPGAVTDGRGLVRQDRRRRRAASATGCATASTATRSSPPCRSATPTACRAGCMPRRRRGADRRPAPPDRRRRHHGPAHGRLRPARRSTPMARAVGDEVVLLGSQGDEAIRRRRVGRRASTPSPTRSCAASARVSPEVPMSRNEAQPAAAGAWRWAPD